MPFGLTARGDDENTVRASLSHPLRDGSFNLRRHLIHFRHAVD